MTPAPPGTVDIRSVSSGAALRVAAIVLGVLIALRFLWFAHAIFIVTFLGVLLGLAIARAADYLERVRVPRSVGAPLVLFIGIGLLVTIGVTLAPSVRNQVGQLATELPKLVDQADRWLQKTPAKGLVDQQQNPQGGGLRTQLTREFRGSFRFLFPIVSSVFGAIGGFVLVLFIALYVAAQPGMYRDGMLHLVPHNRRDRAEEVMGTLALTLRQWLIARLIAMVVVGVTTGVVLALLKVKGAAALGVLAALLEFIPFFGPIGSAIPAIGVALLDSPQKALYVVIFYFVMQQLEGNLLTPLLLEKRLDIPPVLTIVTVAALGVVFGVIGMLIAEPLLAAVLVTTKMLYVTDVVGDEVKVGTQE